MSLQSTWDDRPASFFTTFLRAAYIEAARLFWESADTGGQVQGDDVSTAARRVAAFYPEEPQDALFVLVTGMITAFLYVRGGQVENV